MKLSVYKRRVKSIDGMARRIVDFYTNQTTDAQRTAGTNWYINAHTFCRTLSMQYGITNSTVVAVLSALSPAVKWSTNKQDTTDLIHAHCLTGKLEQCKVSTYGANKLKAIGILDADDPDIPLNTAQFFTEYTKTRSFYFNVLSPIGPPFVTVDRHAIAIAVGSTDTTHQRLCMTSKRYKFITEAYQRAAEQLDIPYPCELQAACWIAYRAAYVDNRYLLESEYADVPF